MTSVLYDPVNENECLQRFQPCLQQTHCIFSKTSRSWGSANWQAQLSLEENALRSLPQFIKFSLLNDAKNLTDPPDNFIFEIRGEQYHKTLALFGDTVRRLLQVLSDCDPTGRCCMEWENVGKVFDGWRMEFNGLKIFLVTFAPCYDSLSARYQFECPIDSCFILLQGSGTFGRHDLGKFTNSPKPKSNRDKIRQLYTKNGRRFNIAVLSLVVKPLNEFDSKEKFIEWWVPLQKDSDPSKARVDIGAFRFVIFILGVTIVLYAINSWLQRVK